MAFDFALNISNEYGQVSLSWDTLGKFNVVRGQDKLQQDILKILGTDINPQDANFSTQLQEIIGSALGKNQTVNKIQTTIVNALNYLQSLQQAQAQIQQVDMNEIIIDIIEVNVDYVFDLTQNIQDLDKYNVGIVVTNGGGQTIAVSRNISSI